MSALSQTRRSRVRVGYAGDADQVRTAGRRLGLGRRRARRLLRRPAASSGEFSTDDRDDGRQRRRRCRGLRAVHPERGDGGAVDGGRALDRRQPFEDAEHQSTTRRTLHNPNDCYAVTYFVRRVNEVYEAHHARRDHRVAARRRPAGARSTTSTDAPDEVGPRAQAGVRELPRRGDVRARRRARSRCRPTARSTRPSSRTARRASPRARKRRGSRSSESACGRAANASRPSGWRSAWPGRRPRTADPSAFTTSLCTQPWRTAGAPFTRSSAPPRCRPRARSTRRPR